MITVGALPFLGLIVPNLIRKRYGDNLSQTKLIVALVGANPVLACDILSRVLDSRALRSCLSVSY